MPCIDKSVPPPRDIFVPKGYRTCSVHSGDSQPRDIICPRNDWSCDTILLRCENKPKQLRRYLRRYLCTSTVLIPTFTVFSSEIQSGKSLTRANDETLLDNVEADCYWCLCKVLDTVQDHFTCSQPGIQRVCHRVNEVRFSLTFQCISPHLLHLLKACQSPWQSAFRASCERGIYLKAENAHWIPCDVLWQPNRVLTSFILHSDGRLACFFASSPAWHLPARWRVIMLSHFPSSSLYLVNSISIW